jgi:hypothetical protein
MLDAIISTDDTATSTPLWLHGLHARKGIFVPSNLQIDNLIYGDLSQPSLRLHLPTFSSCHHKNSLVIAKNEPQKATKLKKCQPPCNLTG